MTSLPFFKMAHKNTNLRCILHPSTDRWRVQGAQHVSNPGWERLTIVVCMIDLAGVLQSIGFTTEQVVNMCSHNGGSKNLAFVTENLDYLRAVGFDAGTRDLDTVSYKLYGHGLVQNTSRIQNRKSLTPILHLHDTVDCRPSGADGGAWGRLQQPCCRQGQRRGECTPPPHTHSLYYGAKPPFIGQTPC